jgi:hypothetical protein
MTKKQTGLDRLEKLGKFIRKGKFPKGQGFHMGVWYMKGGGYAHNCGTAACMGGWAAAMFPKLMKFEDAFKGKFIVYRETDEHSYDALAALFEISGEESEMLFYVVESRPTDHAYHGQRLLDFVAAKRADSTTREEREG